ncbi:MAG TPA: prepilin-type N-terminal cleavage/methylation domain-containing protein [Verrucomicrobiae bacterium]|nr:prepilin-type N-terminal cleavage/methylation domain-containing protein [Verrucomicrobiae bacterium]
MKRNRNRSAAFTLAELVVAIAIMASAMAGLVCGYIQVNYRAEVAAMSLGAQSLAVRSVEQCRAAKWDVHSQTGGTGMGSADEMPPTNFTTIYSNALVVPATGQSVSVTNYVSVSTISTNPPVRMIRSDCVWRAPFKGQWFSNTVISYRSSDQ